MDKRNRYNWTTARIKLIHLVKEYDVYEKMLDKSPVGQASAEIAWDKISDELQVSAKKCRVNWNTISMIYKRLKLMIIEGKMSEFEARKDYRLAKYFDGRLDFLDPYILKASPNQINRIRKNRRTKITLTRLLGYDIDKEKNDSSNNIPIPNEISSVSTKETVVEETGTTVKNLSTENYWKSIPIRRRNDLVKFLVKHSFTKEKKYTLKTYMRELGVAVCNVLEPEERRLFIKDIDAIVSDILQG